MDSHRLLLQGRGSTISKVLSLRVNGRLIRNLDNEIFRVKGLTAFPIINRFSRGQNIDWIFNRFPTANLVRTFWYTPQDEWGPEYWDLPTPDEVFAFHSYLADKGIYVYNTCLTDDASPAKLDLIRAIIRRLQDGRLPNILFESKNEPFLKDKLDPLVIRMDLVKTPYLYTSGIYDNVTAFWGMFGNTHVPRDPQSVRKFKDLEENCSLFRNPWFEGEPFKAGTGYPLLDFYTFAAGTGLMGSGAIYHCDSMKFLNQLSQEELEAGDLFFEGLETYPLDAQLGSYKHLQDLEGIVDNEPTTCLRCFAKDNYAIVVRGNDKFKVPSNWVSLDKYKVAYKIG